LRPSHRAALLAALFSILAFALATGCAAEDASSPGEPAAAGEVRIGHTERGESVALAALIKVLLEEAGREDVALVASGPDVAPREVARGELDVYPSVWVPQEERALEEAGEGARVLNPWLIGNTRSSLAVPAYTNVRSLEEVEATGARKALGVRPEAAAVAADAPEDEVLARYGLKKDFGHASAGAMLEEVGRLYEAREPFVFLAWTPHPMNLEYEFNYLEDPRGVLADLTRPARIHPVVARDLEERDPLAHFLVDAVLVSEYQATDLQRAVGRADSPEEGARAWAEDNRRLTRGWIETARERAEDG
jgi:glycine betaine/proline transport system substrate-binding protein